jgi:hypothetical protein
LSVLVLDKRKRPGMPRCEKRARLLLERSRAVVDRRYPFTIRLKNRVGGSVEPVRVKLDPGRRTTGVAVVADEDGNKPGKVLCLFELAHRGRQIRALVGWQQPTLAIKASGRGDYLTKLTAHGRGSCRRIKSVRGCQTGDMVRAEVPTGNKAEAHVGRVAVHGSGSFRVGNADGINAKYCRLLHRADGYCCARQPALPPRPEERGFQRGRL